jgi:hypothetical protein
MVMAIQPHKQFETFKMQQQSGFYVISATRDLALYRILPLESGVPIIVSTVNTIIEKNLPIGKQPSHKHDSGNRKDIYQPGNLTRCCVNSVWNVGCVVFLVFRIDFF